MADQKIAKCPFCGAECEITIVKGGWHMVECAPCGYLSGMSLSEPEAITAHNRVSQAVATADADAGLFDAVEHCFRDMDLETEHHYQESLDPLWQKYRKRIEAGDPDGDWEKK